MYCVLWGTLLFDYESEEDARQSLSPKLVVEILGVSEWDGKGRSINYPGGILLVTHTGSQYYISCTSILERDEWMLQFRRALECVFANNDIAAFKPSKIIQNRPTPHNNLKCPKTFNPLSAYSPLCKSCGRGFYSAEYINETAVMLQLGSEDPQKVCVDCKMAQLCIIWLKTMNYVQAMNLHELTPNVMKDVSKFKATFTLKRRESQRLHMAAELFEKNELSAEEFEELRSVDHAYEREMIHEECVKLKELMEAFDEDIQTIINILIDPAMTEKGGRNAYFTIIHRLLDIADYAPDLIDFYFPQLFQVHLQLLLIRTVDAHMKIDSLQQMFLVLSNKYPAFGLKLAWSLLAVIGDYYEKKANQVQYAASMCLLMQLEMIMTGCISCIADVPTSKLLSRILKPASHQQQELAFEISSLFLIRRKLQEAYDDEDKNRRERNSKLYGRNNPDIKADEMDKKKRNKSKKMPIFPGANKANSGLELLYQLGVGQAGSNNKNAGIEDDTALNSMHGNPAVSKEAVESLLSDESKSLFISPPENITTTKQVIHYWDGFAQQIDFVGRLDALVESLRFIDRELRTETLQKEVTKWNDPKLYRKKKKDFHSNNHSHLDNSNSDIAGNNSNNNSSSHHHHHHGRIHSQFISDTSLSSKIGKDDDGDDDTRSNADEQTPHVVVDYARMNPYLGWDPISVAGEPQYRVIRVIPEECRVFRTKARAPSLIVCEVMRDDLFVKYGPELGNDVTVVTQASRGKEAQQTAPREISANIEKDMDYSIEGVDVEIIESKPSLAPTTTALIESKPHSREECHSPKDTMIKIAHHTVVSSAGRGKLDQNDSSSEPVNIFSHVVQNLHDVEGMLGASLSPSVLATLQSHKAEPQPMPPPCELEQNPAKESSNSNSNIPSPMSLSAKFDAAQMKYLPRRKSGGVLPANRLSTSTEGILRSSYGAEVLKITSDPPSQKTHPQLVSNAILSRSSANSNKEIITRTPSNQQLDESHGSTLSDNHPFRDEDSTSSRSSRHTYPDLEIIGDAQIIRSNNNNSGLTTAQIIANAHRLLQEGTIDQREYDVLVLSELQFREETAKEEAILSRTKVEYVIGETFQSKKERLLGHKLTLFQTMSSSEELIAVDDDDDAEEDDEEGLQSDGSYWPAFDLRAFIVKTNDDLRQEICCLQLMEIFKEIFEHFQLQNSLYLKPYRIVCTGPSSGVVEVLTDAVSLDALKHTEGFTSLNNYFLKVYDTSPERLAQAKHNFMASLAAYSLFSYLLQVKDRHNGNLLLDAEGHIIHIDFGFILSIAPGGNFSLETAPFKLTEEMVDLLGGLDSQLFGEFVTAFTKGFIALQANCENILSAVTVLSQNSSFPCFQGKAVAPILERLRNRFRSELNVGDAVAHCLDLISSSHNHSGTFQYDVFQYFTNGILR